MDIQPIFAASRRNKFGAILICVQMAVTLAVLCNAIFVMELRLEWIERPTGIDEASIFTITNKWVGDFKDVAARTRRDLALLRSLRGVEDAYASNSYPLAGGGNSGTLMLEPDQHAGVPAANYFADEHAVRTLGLKLLAGRNFTASDIVELSYTPADLARGLSGVIITRALAQELFPNESAVGKAIYAGFPRPITILGVVERLQGPFRRAGGFGSDFRENSLLFPVRYTAPQVTYIMRASRGHLATVMQEAQRALIGADRDRVLKDVRSFSDSRREAYRDDHAFMLVLVAVCIVMVTVTAFGIVGLTSYWVTQRRRQIGIRRALGGTRIAILQYFQTENLLIGLLATVVGCALSVAFNLWAVSAFEMVRLPYYYLGIGGVAILLLGQTAAFWPALRASLVPPALAARST